MMLKILLIIAGVLLLTGLFFLGVMIHDVCFFVRRVYRISSPKLRKKTKLLLLADLHNHSFGPGNERLVKAIRKEAPDGVLIAGDLMTASRKATNEEPVLSLLEGIRKAGIPVYYGMGNHEQKLSAWEVFRKDHRFRRLKEAAEHFGVRFLRNETVFLEDSGIRIFGLELPFELYYALLERGIIARQAYPAKEMAKLIGTPDADSFNLLIAHDPEFFDVYDDWGADLTLSGHMHGGIVRVPFLGGLVSPSLQLFPKYDGGRYRGEKGEMVISRGLGEHTLPVRVFDPAELVVLEFAPCGMDCS